MQQNLPLQFEALFSTPSLVNAEQGFQLFEPSQHTAIKDGNLALVTSNLVFGKRMERFFSQYIAQSERYTLLAENLQLIEDKKTIGELDFLIRDNENHQTIHLEIACKFYIYRPGLSPDKMACWIGPNRRDKLIHKLSKLKERQFPLLHHPITQIRIQEINVNSGNIKQQLFLPGILFIPKGLDGSFGDVNPKAVKGYWLTKDQFEEEDFSNAKLAIPEKENWMLDPKHNSKWLQAESARKLILEKLKSQRSPMVWCKTNLGEYERFFVLWW